MHRFRWAIASLASLLILRSFPAAEPARAEVLAPNWVIYDVANQEVLDSQRMNQRVPMASLTKLMTGLLASETLSPVDEVTIVGEDLGR